jgi:hypothetical protein
MRVELLARRIKDPTHMHIAAEIYHNENVRWHNSQDATPAMKALSAGTVHALLEAYQQGNDAFIREVATELYGKPVEVRVIDRYDLLGLSGSICGLWQRILRATGATKEKQRLAGPSSTTLSDAQVTAAQLRDVEDWLQQKKSALAKAKGPAEGARVALDVERGWGRLAGVPLDAIVRIRLLEEIDRAFIDYGKRSNAALAHQIRNAIQARYLESRANDGVAQLRDASHDPLAPYFPDHLIVAVFEKRKAGHSFWSEVRALLITAEMKPNKCDTERYFDAWSYMVGLVDLEGEARNG